MRRWTEARAFPPLPLQEGEGTGLTAIQDATSEWREVGLRLMHPILLEARREVARPI
jgi:hypothetical protein